MFTRRQLDEAFPTVARYLGLLLLTVLLIATAARLVDLTTAAIFLPTIGGLILYKTVLGRDRDGEDDHVERWSHMP